MLLEQTPWPSNMNRFQRVSFMSDIFKPTIGSAQNTLDVLKPLLIQVHYLKQLELGIGCSWG
jgi:hypothetical protein